jgi:hypothetical protein
LFNAEPIVMRRRRRVASARNDPSGTPMIGVRPSYAASALFGDHGMTAIGKVINARARPTADGRLSS